MHVGGAEMKMGKNQLGLYWVRRGPLVMIGCMILLGLFVSPQVKSFGRHGVPYGSSIRGRDLNGVIGEEWSDATISTSRLGQHSTTVYMKHDVKYWYIAMVIKGWMAGNVRAWVWFDADMDGKAYSVGDDILMLPLTNGRLVSNIDYSYLQTENPSRDIAVGGTDDKAGAGKFADNSYVFEMKIDILGSDRGSSGNDPFLFWGESIRLAYGYHNRGDCIESGKKYAKIELPKGCRSGFKCENECKGDLALKDGKLACNKDEKGEWIEKEGTCEIEWSSDGGRRMRTECGLVCEYHGYRLYDGFLKCTEPTRAY